MDELKDEASRLQQKLRDDRDENNLSRKEKGEIQARIEEIRGIRARRPTKLTDDSGEPILDKNGEQIVAPRYYYDDYDQYVMQRNGRITDIIHEISGREGGDGLYQEQGTLRKMENQLKEKVRELDGNRFKVRMGELNGLQDRFKALGLELETEKDDDTEEEEAVEDEEDSEEYEEDEEDSEEYEEDEEDSEEYEEEDDTEEEEEVIEVEWPETTEG